MYSTNNFRENLAALKAARALSLAEFGVPKSTLQSVLESGQTTLDTACRIASAVNIPLSTLVGGTFSENQFKVLRGFLSQLDWFSRLDTENQRTAAELFARLLKLLEADAAAHQTT